MMSLFSKFKSNAKRALDSQWGRATAVFLIPLGCLLLLCGLMSFVFFNVVANLSLFKSGVLANITSSNYLTFLSSYMGSLLTIFLSALVFFLIAFFILCPLFCGVFHWHYQLVKGTTLPVSGLFHFFENGKRYGRALGLSFSILLRRILWSVSFFLLPAALVTLATVFVSRNSALFLQPNYRILFYIGCVILALIMVFAALLYIVYMNKYFLSPYLLGNDDTLSVKVALRKSLEYTKTYRTDIFFFALSFLPWFLLSIPLFPLLLYTVPYFQTSLAMFAHYIVETNKREKPTIGDAPPASTPEHRQPEITTTPPVADPVVSPTVSNEVNPLWGSDSNFHMEDFDK